MKAITDCLLSVLRNPRRRLDVRDALGFRNRGLFGAIVLVPVGVWAFLSPPHLLENSGLGVVLNALGWILFLLYAALRLWATLFVGGNKDRHLQTEGPYSLCRNPLYLGSLCFALAVALFLKSAVFGLAVLLVGWFYLRFVIRAEEHYLERQFGCDFRDYRRRTPRFFPTGSDFRTPEKLTVDMKRIRQESIRVAKSALLLLALQSLMHWRNSAAWPNWIHLP